MKKLVLFFLASTLFLDALMLATPATHLDVKDETVQQENVASTQFDQWGDEQQKAHSDQRLILILWRKDAASNWTARVYNVAVNPPVLWEESNYPRLSLAVQAVESDYSKYGTGHVGSYKEK